MSKVFPRVRTSTEKAYERGEKMKKEQVTLRLPDNLFKELKEMADQTGLTVSSLLISAIWKHVLGQEN